MTLVKLIWLSLSLLFLMQRQNKGLEPIPNKLVVLTFDDAVASQHRIVRPLLKSYGFGATFFISEGFSFPTNKLDYLTWEEIAELHQDGFEIGNHTRDHLGVSKQTVPQLREQVEAINARCREHGIPKPVSFAYPGNAIVPEALPVLKELGFQFARRGGAPEHPYEWGRGFAFEPGQDHPLLLPSAGDARPDWSLEDFKRAADQAHGGKIAIIQFHGVPDREHPWVSTPPERFESYMLYLRTNGFRVIALRDLSKYVDPAVTPKDPLEIIERRKQDRPEVLLEGEVIDDATRQRLPARVSIHNPRGEWFFPKSTDIVNGSAIRYERRNGGNPRSVEMHTTVSPHPFRVELSPGTYTLTVEHGKEFLPEVQEVMVKPGMPRLTIRLKRWVNMNAEGWFSGDTHNHRHPAELANVQLAEDLNVALPMVDWTTSSTISPTASTQGFPGKYSHSPVSIDSTHLWMARNTEYEIFKVGTTNHTLGALVILNHQTRLDRPVIPLTAVAQQARQEGALLDLEKHNWPWSIALVPILNIDLFELANNHHWQTEYAVRNWAVPAPAWMNLAGSGTDDERDWTLYGFQTYYALLNCGFHLRPTAGTANGVHPVPLGFSRVYVHLDEPFSFAAWMHALGAGHSFVTTGPMLLAQVDGRWPGETSNENRSYRLQCTVKSEQPLETLELVVNGEVAQQFTPVNHPSSPFCFENNVSLPFTPTQTSWIAWRCFEKRPNGRFRFAHSAPSYFQIGTEPFRARRAEIDWLVSRVKEEIERSKLVVPAELTADYRRALDYYQKLAATAR